MFREHQPPPVPVGGCMCGNETEWEEERRTSTHFLPVIHSTRLPDPAAHVPTGVGVAGGGRKTVRQAPTQVQATVGESELSQSPVTCAPEENVASSPGHETCNERGRRTRQPAWAWGVSGGWETVCLPHIIYETSRRMGGTRVFGGTWKQGRR